MPWLTPDGPIPTDSVCRRIRIPNDLTWIAAVSGALTPLTAVYNWEQDGTLTPTEVAEEMENRVYEFISEDSWCMAGVIIPFASADLPPHTLMCDGGVYNRVDYPALYAVLDAYFIIDADTFRVPDLIGRFLLGATLAGGSDYLVGTAGGEVDHTLTIAEIPAHDHSESTAVATAIAVGPGAPAPSAFPGTGVTGSTGGDGAHNNMPPFLALKYAIIYE